MFPQLANQPSGVLPADTCTFTDHVLKKQRSMVLRKKNKKGKLKAGQFFCYILGYSQGF